MLVDEKVCEGKRSGDRLRWEQKTAVQHRLW
jgi:hypothetical protein